MIKNYKLSTIPLLFLCMCQWGQAGGVGLPIPHINTSQTQSAYKEALRFLKEDNLPDARQVVADIVAATIAHAPACVTTPNGTSETVTYFPKGEALRFYQTVPGGRVSYYELRPTGVYRVWQGIPTENTSGVNATSRLFGLKSTDLQQCGRAPNDQGILAFFKDAPFTADYSYGYIMPDNKKIVTGNWKVKQNLGDIRRLGLSVFHKLPGESAKY